MKVTVYSYIIKIFSVKSNYRAIKALLGLVLTVVIIFLIEKKFLVSELRGETISQYDKIKWVDKVLLLIDDFEGLQTDSASLVKEGFFSFGNAKISIDNSQIDDNLIASKSSLMVEWRGVDNYGGWGKGVGKNIDLNTLTDHLNFRMYVPKSNGDEETIKIMLEEDDDNNGVLEKDKDDSWAYRLKVSPKDEWQFISIPIKDFKDDNEGGDSVLNITRKGGLHTIIFSFEQTEQYAPNYKWYFDFICFTNEKVAELEIE